MSTIIGTAADEVLTATPGVNFFILGNNGNDLIVGNNGNDTLQGGFGSDTIYGGDGNDSIQGNQDNDFLYGNAGNDTLQGGQGVDYVDGGDGDDFVQGNRANDTLVGGLGNDRLDESGDVAYTELGILIAAGNNMMYGNQGNDILAGGSGDDWMHGGQDNDLLIGNRGDDTLVGGKGLDTLFGGLGDDVIDLIDNGNRNEVDVVVFNVNASATDGSNDTVLSFVQGVDKIKLVDIVSTANQSTTAVLSYVVFDTVSGMSIDGNQLTFGNGTGATFVGLSQLYWDDFDGGPSTLELELATADIFDENGLSDSFLAMINGYRRENVEITVTDELSVDEMLDGDSGISLTQLEALLSSFADVNLNLSLEGRISLVQAQALQAAGLDLVNDLSSYTLEDAATTVQAALSNPALKAIMEGAERVYATGNELENILDFRAFTSANINLTIEGGAGNDSINSSSGGDDFIVGGAGADRIALTTTDLSVDNVVYTESSDGASYNTVHINYRDGGSDWKSGVELTLKVDVSGTSFPVSTVVYHYVVGATEETIPEDGLDPDDSDVFHEYFYPGQPDWSDDIAEIPVTHTETDRGYLLEDFARLLQAESDAYDLGLVITRDSGILAIRSEGFGVEAGPVLPILAASLYIPAESSVYQAYFPDTPSSSSGDEYSANGALFLKFKDEDGTEHFFQESFRFDLAENEGEDATLGADELYSGNLNLAGWSGLGGDETQFGEEGDDQLDEYQGSIITIPDLSYVNNTVIEIAFALDGRSVVMKHKVGDDKFALFARDGSELATIDNVYDSPASGEDILTGFSNLLNEGNFTKPAGFTALYRTDLSQLFIGIHTQNTDYTAGVDGEDSYYGGLYGEDYNPGYDAIPPVILEDPIEEHDFEDVGAATITVYTHRTLSETVTALKAQFEAKVVEEGITDELDVTLGDVFIINHYPGTNGEFLRISLKVPLAEVDDEIFELIEYAYKAGDAWDDDFNSDELPDMVNTPGSDEELYEEGEYAVTTIDFATNTALWAAGVTIKVTLEEPDNVFEYVIESDVAHDPEAVLERLVDLINDDDSLDFTAELAVSDEHPTRIVLTSDEWTPSDNGLVKEETGLFNEDGQNAIYEVTLSGTSSHYALGNKIIISAEIDLDQNGVIDGLNEEYSFEYTVVGNQNNATANIAAFQTAWAADLAAKQINAVMEIGAGLEGSVASRTIEVKLGDDPGTPGVEISGLNLTNFAATIQTTAKTNVITVNTSQTVLTLDFGTQSFDAGDVITIKVPVATEALTPTYRNIKYTVGESVVYADMDNNGNYDDIDVNTLESIDLAASVTPAFTANDVAALFARAITISFDKYGEGGNTAIFVNNASATSGVATLELTGSSGFVFVGVSNDDFVHVNNIDPNIAGSVALSELINGIPVVAADVAGNDIDDAVEIAAGNQGLASDVSGDDDEARVGAVAEYEALDLTDLLEDSTVYVGMRIQLTLSQDSSSQVFYSDPLSALTDSAVGDMLTSLSDQINDMIDEDDSPLDYLEDAAVSGLVLRVTGNIIVNSPNNDNDDDDEDIAESFSAAVLYEDWHREFNDEGFGEDDQLRVEEGVDEEFYDLSEGDGVTTRDFYDVEWGTPGSNWDIVTGFQIGKTGDASNDVIRLAGNLADTTIGHDRELDFVWGADGEDSFSSGEDFDLDNDEFGLIDRGSNAASIYSVNKADLTDASKVAALLEDLFDFDSGSYYFDDKNHTSVFAITAADDIKQTAIWVHTQSYATDSDVQADELQLLAIVNTNANSSSVFDEDNLGLTTSTTVSQLDINFDFEGDEDYLDDEDFDNWDPRPLSESNSSIVSLYREMVWFGVFGMDVDLDNLPDEIGEIPEALVDWETEGAVGLFGLFGEDGGFFDGQFGDGVENVQAMIWAGEDSDSNMSFFSGEFASWGGNPLNGDSLYSGLVELEEVPPIKLVFYAIDFFEDDDDEETPDYAVVGELSLLLDPSGSVVSIDFTTGQVEGVYDEESKDFSGSFSGVDMILFASSFDGDGPVYDQPFDINNYDEENDPSPPYAAPLVFADNLVFENRFMVDEVGVAGVTPDSIIAPV